MARRLKKEDGLIHWNKSALDIINLIRGCVPWPGAFTYYRGQLVKIYQGQVSHPQSFSSSSVCGELISIGKSGIGVACGTDAILIKELQVEGRRRMSAENFLTGHKLRVGEILGEKR